MSKMSKTTKKYRKQKRKASTGKYVAGGVVGLVLIVVAALSFGSPKASQPPVIGGTPVVSVEKKQIDFGNLKDYTNITIKFTVTNTGTGMLNFSEKPYVEVLEGCCPPELTIGKMALRPGESTTVKSNQFFMHPGMDGKHNFAVHLKTNDSTQPDLVVNVLSNWSQ